MDQKKIVQHANFFQKNTSPAEFKCSLQEYAVGKLYSMSSHFDKSGKQKLLCQIYSEHSTNAMVLNIDHKGFRGISTELDKHMCCIPQNKWRKHKGKNNRIKQ